MGCLFASLDQSKSKQDYGRQKPCEAGNGSNILALRYRKWMMCAVYKPTSLIIPS